jgi:hypothetical protein
MATPKPHYSGTVPALSRSRPCRTLWRLFLSCLAVLVSLDLLLSLIHRRVHTGYAIHPNRPTCEADLEAACVVSRLKRTGAVRSCRAICTRTAPERPSLVDLSAGEWVSSTVSSITAGGEEQRLLAACAFGCILGQRGPGRLCDVVKVSRP